mmetsp:Transcript_14345/g.19640  ORF Transcript_14345/g.19640 Transcript_14345/m.19640 type:complete len:83 (+) Transcript_14345:654-902(+)
MFDEDKATLRAAEATCTDSVLHSAAYGDQEAKNTVLKTPEEFINKIAMAGYLPLLTAIIKQRKDLVDFIDRSTERTPLINAA